MEGLRKGRERLQRTVSYPGSRREGSGNLFYPHCLIGYCGGHERYVRSPRESASLVGAGELSRVRERWGSESHQVEDIKRNECDIKSILLACKVLFYKIYGFFVRISWEV